MELPVDDILNIASRITNYTELPRPVPCSAIAVIVYISPSQTFWKIIELLNEKKATT